RPPGSASQPPGSGSQPKGAAAQNPAAGSPSPALVPARLPPGNASPPRPRPVLAARTAAPVAEPQQASLTAGQISQTTAVSFRCGGPQEVCGPLRSALDDALGKASLRSVRDPSRAEVQVEATVAGTQGRTSSE